VNPATLHDAYTVLRARGISSLILGDIHVCQVLFFSSHRTDGKIAAQRSGGPDVLRKQRQCSEFVFCCLQQLSKT
jgi:hypothetical protein